MILFLNQLTPMKRFIKSPVLQFAFGLLIFFPWLSQAQAVDYAVHPDGSFDISGASITLKNCYPSLGNESIRSIRHEQVKTKSNVKLIYHLANGRLELVLEKKEGEVALQTTFTGSAFDFATISPIANAKVIGAYQFFRNAEAIMGQAGVSEWPNQKKEKSALITGLMPKEGYSLIVATRNIKKYVSYSEVYAFKSGEDKRIGISIQTEKIKPDVLPTIFFTENKSVYDGMRNEAGKIATTMNVKNDKPQAYHWCSWYYTFNYLTESMLADYLNGFETISPKVPIQTVQIDAGYHPHLGDWLEPSEKFPKGLESSVKSILQKGYKAGVWIAPYMVGNRSKLYKEHPDWILRWGDNSPVMFMNFYDESRLFGALDEEIYTLDSSNPAAMEYLRNVFRTFKKMGITFFKTDFMLWGDQQSQTLSRHTPGKTSVEYQHELFDMIRQEIGQESFWLGCIAPYAPMIGYVDGMRISADITSNWKGGASMFKESVGCQHFNNIWWQNDPDAIILRKKFNLMTDKEAESLTLWMGMLGGMINTSDVLNELPDDRLKLFRELEPSSEKWTASFPFIDKPIKADVMLRKYSSIGTYAVLFTNRKEEAIEETVNINTLINQQPNSCYEWTMGGKIKTSFHDSINVKLDPHESKLFFLSTDDRDIANLTIGGK